MEKKKVYEEYVHWRDMLFYDNHPDAFALSDEEKLMARKYMLAKKVGMIPDEMSETWFHEYIKMPVCPDLDSTRRRINRLKELHGG